MPASKRHAWLSRVLTVLMLSCFAAGGWNFAGNTESAASTVSSASTSDAAQTSSTIAELGESSNATGLETQPIETIRLGQRVLGRNPLRHETQSPSVITPDSWQAVHLTMKQHGVDYQLSLLRPRSWLRATGQEASPLEFNAGGTV
jgi:hypothetical protein